MDGYNYQAGDGADVAISALPRLLKDFHKDSHEIKRILHFTLIDSYPLGMSQKLSDYSSRAILTLWGESPADAQSLLCGYLQMKPLYDELWESFRKESQRKGTYNFSKKELLKQFSKKYKNEINKILENKNEYADVGSIEQINTDTLVTAFEFLPIEIPEEYHKTFVKQIIPVLSKKLFNDRHGRDEDESFDYGEKHRFLDKLSCILLSLKPEDIESYIKPILDGFKDSKDAAEFFESFISAEDRLAQYEQFWTVWKLFYPKVVPLAQGKGSRFYSKEVIRTYLLAWSFCREGVTEWHTLKDREKSFFKKASEDMGASPSTLYSLAKLLTDIGSGFKEEGIIWISDMLKNNPDLSNQELELNSVYYLENLMRGYVLKNRHKVKTILSLKTKILVILDFLLSKGSVTAYMLREDIL
jgi:hypothetical protein